MWMTENSWLRCRASVLLSCALVVLQGLGSSAVAQVCQSLVLEEWDAQDVSERSIQLAGFLEPTLVDRLALPSFFHLERVWDGVESARSGFGNGFPLFDLESLSVFLDSLVTNGSTTRLEVSEAALRMFYLRGVRPPFLAPMMLAVIDENRYPTAPFATAVGDLRLGFEGRYDLFRTVLERRDPSDRTLLGVSRMYCQITLLRSQAAGVVELPIWVNGLGRNTLRRWLFPHRERLAELLGCQGDCLELSPGE